MKRYQDLVVEAEPPRHLIYAADRHNLQIVERVNIEDSALMVEACIYDVPSSTFGVNALAQEWSLHGASLGGVCSTETHHHTVRVRVLRSESYQDVEIDVGTAATLISAFMRWVKQNHALVIYASDAQTGVT